MRGRMYKTIYCALGVLIILTLPINGLAQPKPVVKEWRIPTLIFLSGPFAGHGVAIKWVIEEVAAEINASGGIAGKPIVNDFMDSAMDPTKAAACMSRAIDGGALCVIGPPTELECKGSLPLAKQEGIFAFSAMGTETTTPEFAPWTIYVGRGTADRVKATIPMWVGVEPDIKMVAGFVFTVFDAWIREWQGHEKTAAGLGIKSGGKIDVSPGMVDYGPLVVKALNTGANAFILITTEEINAKLVKELVNRGSAPSHIWIQSGGMGTSFMSQTKGINEGIYSNESLTYEYTSRWAKLSSSYAKSHGGLPLVGTAYAFADMMYMIKAAIEHEAITGDPAKLKEERKRISDYAFNQKGFKGVKFTYDVVNGVARGVPVPLFQIRENKGALVSERVP